MSNLDVQPAVEECAAVDATAGQPPQLLEPRDVPLGGPRAARVRRTLPHRTRSLIGAWCFADHFGPNDLATPPVMNLPGHPHTGLQTVSWLFAGEIEHRDTVGSHQVVRAGEVNLMTAGRGIAHSEFVTPATTVLHGVQLWVALPEAERFGEPRFEHHRPVPIIVGDARVSVFIGSLLGSTSPVRTATPLLGAQLDVPARTTLTLPVDPAFEHGILVDAGEATARDTTAAHAELLYLPSGAATLEVTAGDAPLRAVLLGGTPLGERLVMWWNFVGRSHEEIVRFRGQWQQQLADPAHGPGAYGRFPDAWRRVLPAPTMPNVRLRPRI